ncbi:MAG: SMP-30/gluconolactonase/LRE family protein [Opitutaceae bacterium]
MSHKSSSLSRRQFCGAVVGGAALGLLTTQAADIPAPIIFPLGALPDSRARVIALDPRFQRLMPEAVSIERLQTGSTWSEGPAWNIAGRYFVWSDVPNSRQYRWLEEDGHVSVFRHPTGHTNGSTFDFQGRMLCCEQDGHRVVRHEPDASVTVLASEADGKALNSPNDIVVHPDGGIWFTDPGYGVKGALPQREATYRIDPISGAVERVDASLAKPNGICFSPDFKRLYVADTGAPEPKPLVVFDVVDGRRLARKRPFATIEYNGLVAGPDGQQVDIEGNLWASAGHGPDGVNGVQVFAPDGTRLGVILLPETCANVCFGGTARNRLFMPATSSLYVVTTATRGAHLS